MKQFKLRMTRTETHSIERTITAETLQEAKEKMQEYETDGHYDEFGSAKWRYEHGQVDSIEEIPGC